MNIIYKLLLQTQSKNILRLLIEKRGNFIYSINYITLHYNTIIQYTIQYYIVIHSLTLTNKILKLHSKLVNHF